MKSIKQNFKFLRMVFSYRELLPFFVCLAFLIPIEVACAVNIGPFFEKFAEEGSNEQTAYFFLVVGLLYLRFFSSLLYIKKNAEVIYKFQSSLSSKTAQLIASFNSRYFERFASSELIQKVIKDVDFLREHYIGSIIDLIVEGTVIALLFIVILVQSPSSFLILTFGLSLAVVAFYFIVIRPVRKMGRVRQKQEGKRLTQLEVFLTGFYDVRQFKITDQVMENFEAANNTLADVGGRQKFLQSLPRAVIDLFIPTAALMFAGFSLMQSEAFVGLAAEISLVAYVLYRALPGAIKISNAFNGIYFSRDCLTTVVAFLKNLIR